MRIESDRLAVGDGIGLGAGQQQQADVERVAVVQARVAWRDHRGHAQMPERAGGLLARRAYAEVRAGHDHVAGLHLRREFGAHGFQAVTRNSIDAVFHRVARCQLVGVDLGGQPPRPHDSISRASPIVPRTADAATVYGEARYTRALGEPMRPLKLRAVDEITVLPSGIALP